MAGKAVRSGAGVRAGDRVKKPKKPRTVDSRIASALRALWLRSAGRAAAIRRARVRPGVYGCERCECDLYLTAKKGDGREKPHVHHINGVSWHEIYRLVKEQLLVDADKLLVVCKKCHKEIHREEKG